MKATLPKGKIIKMTQEYGLIDDLIQFIAFNLKKKIAINKIDWFSYKIFHERGKYCKQSQEYIIYTFVFRDLHIFTFIFILFCVIAVKISNC